MMYKSQFWKIDPYDWFCAPRSHIIGVTTDIYIILCQYLLYCYKDLIDLHHKHQNFIIINQTIAIKAWWSNMILNKTQRESNWPPEGAGELRREVAVAQTPQIRQTDHWRIRVL